MGWERLPPTTLCMRIVAIVQARMSSQRLPGKILADMGGRPLLQVLLDGLSKGLRGIPVLVATSTDPTDDAVADLCAGLGVSVHRGPLEDVALRFAQVVRKEALGAFVRISGDSPFLDPHLVSTAVGLFRRERPDLVSNVNPRTFPKGQSVEVVDGSVFLQSYGLFEESDDYEHVTRYFYQHAERYRIVSLLNDVDMSGETLAVDTPEDLGKARELFSATGGDCSGYSWEELVQLKRDTGEAVPRGR